MLFVFSRSVFASFLGSRTSKPEYNSKSTASSTDATSPVDDHSSPASQSTRARKVRSSQYRNHAQAGAGGVNTAQHTSRMHQGGDPACTSCGNGSVKDEAHIFWRCGAYTPIRAKAEYAAIVAAEKRDWPRCLLEHGIATTRTRDLVGPVQSLMAEILAERARHVNQVWKDRKARTPWELCGQNPVRRYDFPYQRITTLRVNNTKSQQH
ncbi:hypothetical protein DIPPA_04015 [Diplonema papillatum]|nr:hypothetical protein DIPPA_04015 [Diplonema papillatum]